MQNPYTAQALVYGIMMNHAPIAQLNYPYSHYLPKDIRDRNQEVFDYYSGVFLKRFGGELLEGTPSKPFNNLFKSADIKQENGCGEFIGNMFLHLGIKEGESEIKNYSSIYVALRSNVRMPVWHANVFFNELEQAAHDLIHPFAEVYLKYSQRGPLAQFYLSAFGQNILPRDPAYRLLGILHKDKHSLIEGVEDLTSVKDLIYDLKTVHGSEPLIKIKSFISGKNETPYFGYVNYDLPKLSWTSFVQNGSSETIIDFILDYPLTNLILWNLLAQFNLTKLIKQVGEIPYYRLDDILSVNDEAPGLLSIERRN